MREDGKLVLTGQGSVRARALRNVAHRKVRRWVNLTGSPAPNGIVDLYGPMWFVDGGRRLGTNFKSFSDRYFYGHRTPDGYTQLRPTRYAQAEIEGLIKDVCITIDARDYFDIEEPIVRNIMVDLPPKARAAYLTMEKELFADIDHHLVEVFSAGGKVNKCLQLASGSVYVDDKRNWVAAHDEKIEALHSLREELSGEPMLVRYCYRPDLERILKAFPRARFLDDKQSTEDAWNAGDIPLMVTHAASAGHGLSLQHGGRVLVDYSSDFNLEQDEQIIERIGPTRQVQSGYDRAVYRYRLVARDTLEEHSVLPRLKYKMSVQDSLKNAMRIRA
jgi:SNF2 family DNA or RNA helicase